MIAKCPSLHGTPTAIRYKGVREGGVYHHEEGPTKDPPETPQASQHYGVMALEEEGP